MHPRISLYNIPLFVSYNFCYHYLTFYPQLGSQFGDQPGASNYDTIIAFVNDGVLVPIDGDSSSVHTTDTSGVWTNFGSYAANDEKWSSIQVKIDDEAGNAHGTLDLKHSTAPPAWACGPGTGTNLASLIDKSSSTSEIKTLEGTNWAHLAGGVGSMSV